MIACINAVGNDVPPMLISPRVHFKDYMLNGAPPESRIHRGGMTHFIQHVKPSKEDSVFLLFDNHDSLLTISDCRLQPSDVSIFGPYKTYYNQAVSEWMLNNLGKPLTIYQVAEIVGKAYPNPTKYKRIFYSWYFSL